MAFIDEEQKKEFLKNIPPKQRSAVEFIAEALIFVILLICLSASLKVLFFL
jgi:hypothetical protein